jgi:2-oxoisovalerate dehydrogenase E1 component beta subunit
MSELVTLATGLNRALFDAMEADPTVLMMGEDVGRLGGVFRITDGLHARFGDQRVIDTPLSESGIIGTAIGLAMRGFRPVCEIQFDGFVFPAFDQIVTQLAKHHFRSEGRTTLPVTIRIPYGGGIGAVEHHSESIEAYFAHTAGLRIVTPSHARDGYQMLREAIACDDPVIFLEPKRRYWDKAELGPVAEGLFDARIVRAGTDVTVVCYGPMVRTCLEAAGLAEEEDEVSLEVIDLRSLSPVDFDSIYDSVRRTGRCVVVHEAPVFAGFGAEIAARVHEHCFYDLEAPVLRVGAPHAPYPPSKLERLYLPDVDRILDAIDTVREF